MSVGARGQTTVPKVEESHGLKNVYLPWGRMPLRKRDRPNTTIGTLEHNNWG